MHEFTYSTLKGTFRKLLGLHQGSQERPGTVPTAPLKNNTTLFTCPKSKAKTLYKQYESVFTRL